MEIGFVLYSINLTEVAENSSSMKNLFNENEDIQTLNDFGLRSKMMNECEVILNNRIFGLIIDKRQLLGRYLFDGQHVSMTSRPSFCASPGNWEANFPNFYTINSIIENCDLIQTFRQIALEVRIKRVNNMNGDKVGHLG